MSFFNKEEVLDNFASSGQVDLIHGLVTVYAVICVGDGSACPRSSHGGGITLDANDAIAVAEAANESGESNCRYLPVPMGIDPADIMRLTVLLQSDGFEEPQL
jgi:hypothetical protein